MKSKTLTLSGLSACLFDADYLILTSPGSNTGNFYIDDELLAAHSITDLEKYSVTPGTKDFIPDFSVD